MMKIVSERIFLSLASLALAGDYYRRVKQLPEFSNGESKPSIISLLFQCWTSAACLHNLYYENSEIPHAVLRADQALPERRRYHVLLMREWEFTQENACTLEDLNYLGTSGGETRGFTCFGPHALLWKLKNEELQPSERVLSITAYSRGQGLFSEPKQENLTHDDVNEMRNTLISRLQRMVL